MKPSGPLSAAEKAVFGEHAVRDPVTGVPIEVGSGSAHHQAQIEQAAAGREAACRGDAVGAPQPTPTPPPSQPEQRTIDIRQIHPFPERTQ
jgi:hypothetical protein